jgi:hypothetical protein
VNWGYFAVRSITHHPLPQHKAPEGKAAPSELLAIRNFVRPLRVPQVQEMLERYGTVRSFWMNQLKSRCYVLVCAWSLCIRGAWGVAAHAPPHDIV